MTAQDKKHPSTPSNAPAPVLMEALTAEQMRHVVGGADLPLTGQADD